MSGNPDDRDLRERFAHARTSDLGRTPPFERVRRGRDRGTLRPPRFRLALAGGALVLLAAVGLSARRLRSHRADVEAVELAQQVSTWRSATDFLLEIPGTEYLSTVPRIGEIPSWYSPGSGDTLPPPAEPKENDTL